MSKRIKDSSNELDEILEAKYELQFDGGRLHRLIHLYEPLDYTFDSIELIDFFRNSISGPSMNKEFVVCR